MRCALSLFLATLFPGISIEFFSSFVVPIHRIAVQPVIVHMIHGICARLNGLCSCVHWVRQLKRMFRFFSSLLSLFFVGSRVSSIKMAHNDTKAGRKRHIQLRQTLPLVGMQKQTATVRRGSRASREAISVTQTRQTGNDD